MNEDLYQFIVSDYAATGEGRTISMLITRAYPLQEDYATEPYFDDDGILHLGELKNSAKFRAAREFKEKFGPFVTLTAENIPYDEFIQKYSHTLSRQVLDMLQGNSIPGNFNFYQQFHYNYS